MTNKEKYSKFYKQEKSIPIFMSPQWLNSVCEDGLDWNVILYEKGGEVWGSFVYCWKRHKGLFYILMPKLTQFLGPYIKYPKGQKYYKRLSWEKEIMNYFIDNLPKFDYFSLSYHYTVTNWLPFYWRGFKQTTHYTYTIDNDIKMEQLSKHYETDSRRRRRKKAEKLGVLVEESTDLNVLYELSKRTFERQNRNMPYSFGFLQKIYKNNINNIKINLAKYNNTYIAGNLLLIDDFRVIYLIGGIDSNYKDLGAMDLIQYESIKFALKSGKVFDFEGSMKESIEQYFRSFGSVQKPYFQITKNNSKILKLRDCVKELLK